MGKSNIFLNLTRTGLVLASFAFPDAWAEPVAIWLSVGAIAACAWAQSVPARVAGACCAAAPFGWFWMDGTPESVVLFATTAAVAVTFSPRFSPAPSSQPA